MNLCAGTTLSRNCRGSLTRRVDSRAAASTTSMRPLQVQVHFSLRVSTWSWPNLGKSGAPGTCGAPPPDCGGGGGPRGGGPLGGGPRGGAPLGGAPRGAPGGGPRGGAPRLWGNQPVSRMCSAIEAPRILIATQRCAVADLLVRLAAADLSEGRPVVLQAVARAAGVLRGNKN